MSKSKKGTQSRELGEKKTASIKAAAIKRRKEEYDYRTHARAGVHGPSPNGTQSSVPDRPNSVPISIFCCIVVIVEIHHGTL